MASKRKRNQEKIMPTNEDDTTNTPAADWDKVIEEAETLPIEATPAQPVTEADIDAEFDRLTTDDAEQRFAKDASEIADNAAKLSDALGGEPVSEKNEPITLVEPVENMRTMRLGDMTVIATPERIQVLREHEEAAVPVRPVAPVAMTQRISDKISAEQEAGRRALQRQHDRAVLHPRPARTEAELAREKGSTPVFTPDSVTKHQSHMLNTPVPGKGAGY